MHEIMKLNRSKSACRIHWGPDHWWVGACMMTRSAHVTRSAHASIKIGARIQSEFRIQIMHA